MIDPDDSGAIQAALDALPGIDEVRACLEDPAEPCWVVGGTARDLLLGIAPGELDLAVPGDALELARKLAGRVDGALTVHPRFMTATVVSGGLRVDVATTRREHYGVPGCLPEVERAMIDDDLLRRDFSVNAIAIPLVADGGGPVRALPGALDDLRAGVLRVLHGESFSDDPTRLWRLARYSARLSFAVEPRTHELAQGAIADGCLATVSLERKGAELIKALGEDDPETVLDAAAALGLLAEIGATGWDRDRFKAAAAFLGIGRPDSRLALACCFARSGIERETAAALCADSGLASLACSAGRSAALTEAMRQAHAASALHRLLSGVVDEVVAIAGADGATEAAARWFGGLASVEPLVSGGDLRAAGVPEGPGVARGLAAALDLQLDEGVVDLERLTACAIAAAVEGGGDGGP